MGIETYFKKFGSKIDRNTLSKRKGIQIMKERLAFLCGAIIGSIENDSWSPSEQLLEYVNEYQRIHTFAAEFGIDTKETDNQTNAALRNAGYEFLI